MSRVEPPLDHPRRARSQRGLKAPLRRRPVATRATAALLHTWQRHIKSHPATRGGGKLNGQSNVLPCVFAGSVVSDTPQRLWLGARWTVTAQGRRGKCLMYVVNQAEDPAIAPWNHGGAYPLDPWRDQGLFQSSRRAWQCTRGKPVTAYHGVTRRTT